MQPDGGPGWPAAPLGQIAYLVDEPQPVAAFVADRRPPPGQRVLDPPLIGDLADQLGGGVPDAQGAAVGTVAQGIGGQLADRQGQVVRAVGGKPHRSARRRVSARTGCISCW